ncbi:MAG: tripartite tricarboxylate transporter substrate-binding protein [Beijerinckiaceae bacterium]|nr:tripartite tricarboxylate transporter substrate-binding protein [Beijerinckiaceae bacterium]
MISSFKQRRRSVKAARRLTGSAVVILALCSTGALADAVEAFYSKNNLTVAVGTGVGGSHDGNARVLARFIGKYIPGNPAVVVQNIPGAGSLTLANQLNHTARRDGSFIGALNRAAVFEELYTGRSTKLKFNPLELNWIGAPDRITGVAISWHTSPVKTAKDLLHTQLIVGSSGGTTTTVPKMMEEAANFKFKIVMGYKSGGDVDLAIERGEIEGRAATAWGGLKGRNTSWIMDKKINLLYQTGLSKHPELPDVPLALEFARNSEDRRMMELFFAAEDIGYPYAAPPQTTPAMLAALREGFARTMKDPDFISELQKQSLDVNPVSWEAMTKIIHDAYTAPEHVKSRLRNALKE